MMIMVTMIRCASIGGVCVCVFGVLCPLCALVSARRSRRRAVVAYYLSHDGCGSDDRRGQMAHASNVQRRRRPRDDQCHGRCCCVGDGRICVPAHPKRHGGRNSNMIFRQHPPFDTETRRRLLCTFNTGRCAGRRRGNKCNFDKSNADNEKKVIIKKKDPSIRYRANGRERPTLPFPPFPFILHVPLTQMGTVGRPVGRTELLIGSARAERRSRARRERKKKPFFFLGTRHELAV